MIRVRSGSPHLLPQTAVCCASEGTSAGTGSQLFTHRLGLQVSVRSSVDLVESLEHFARAPETEVRPCRCA